jgi:hypothetical protein
MHSEEQDLIPSSDRAALLSVRNLLFRGAFIAIGPPIGSAIDRYGMHSTLIVTGALFAIAGVAAWAWLASSRKPVVSTKPAAAPSVVTP